MLMRASISRRQVKEMSSSLSPILYFFWYFSVGLMGVGGCVCVHKWFLFCSNSVLVACSLLVRLTMLLSCSLSMIAVFIRSLVCSYLCCGLSLLPLFCSSDSQTRRIIIIFLFSVHHIHRKEEMIKSKEDEGNKYPLSACFCFLSSFPFPFPSLLKKLTASGLLSLSLKKAVLKFLNKLLCCCVK